MYFRENVLENVTLVLNTNHKDLLTTNVSKIEVTDSADPKHWPIELFGRDAGHEFLKANAFPPSIE